MRFEISLAILVLIGLGTSAQARPRDEVMSQAFRCGGISDLHLWLDCIYGSAQPIRAELRLAPVTPHQAELVASPPVTGGPIGDQSTRDRFWRVRRAVARSLRSDNGLIVSTAQPMPCDWNWGLRLHP